MTYRERRERRAERLRGWAEKRQTDAAATLARDEHYRGDHAFTFQPGHIPERARVIARADRAFASLRKADQMAARAASIDSQVSAAIYSDDHDAIEQLTARIARLESERDRKKTINREIRKGDGWSARITPPLTTDERTDLTTLAQVGQFRNGFPAYVFQNLAGNITRQRQRLARLQADAAQRARVAAVLAAERTQEEPHMPCLLIDGGETIQLTIAEAEAEERAGRIAVCETCCEDEPETTVIYHRTDDDDCRKDGE